MLSLLLRGEFCLRQLENGHTENEQKCPSVRTLTAVHGAVLEDLFFLSKIVGKRIHVMLNGSLLTKVHLDKAQQSDMGTRLKVSLVSLRSSPAGMLTLSFKSFSWGKKLLGVLPLYLRQIRFSTALEYISIPHQILSTVHTIESQIL